MTAIAIKPTPIPIAPPTLVLPIYIPIPPPMNIQPTNTSPPILEPLFFFEFLPYFLSFWFCENLIFF